jgi:NADPH:quinone reductase-like Zn-dependent oxidoreductase
MGWVRKTRMKAMVYTEYGPPDVLELQEVEVPTPQHEQVLVKVHAAAVNYGDWAFVRGKPFLVRLMGAGLLKPQYSILGLDIAGRVEAVGRDAKQFQPGDEVFGEVSTTGWGGFAEYAAAPEGALVPKPANLTFEEAAAVPQASVVALQGLRNEGKIQPGRKGLDRGSVWGCGHVCGADRQVVRG